MNKLDIRIKRAYEPASRSDGRRVLVDRLWPRGVSKEEAAIDAWEKEVAPSTELRKWFGHDPANFSRFRESYREELRHHKRDLKELRRWARESRVTLVYGAKDEKINHAVVLAEALRRGLPRSNT